MRARGQFLAAALVVVVSVGGAIALQDGAGPRPSAAAPAAEAPSGAWLCPHGGGSEWQVTIRLANPGPQPVRVRVSRLGSDKPTEPKGYTVEPGTELQLAQPAPERGSSTVVQYFGGWVAAGWVAHAGGGEGGVAAEPCLPGGGDRWLVPDGSAAEGQDDYVVVMNPYAVDAVFTLTLYTTKRPAPITPGEWTNVVLHPHRSEAFRLNPKALGEATVSTLVDVEVGRVAVAGLGISSLGGIRSGVGVEGTPPTTAILPGGFDQGATDLIVADPTERPAAVRALLISKEASQAVASLTQSSTNPGSAATYPVTSEGPSALVVHPPAGVAVARRTLGVTSDQGSTTGSGTPARAWVILPSVAGPPTHPGLVMANPGSRPVDVTLTYLPSGVGPVPAPITVQVPARRVLGPPRAFIEAKPFAAILAVASDGTFVPASASYSLGREGYAAYAVSLGVPVPEAWIPG
ncbi:MAG: DUF5719 family protein [Candidatus Velamenicoccus archaeovorus]